MQIKTSIWNGINNSINKLLSSITNEGSTSCYGPLGRLNVYMYVYHTDSEWGLIGFSSNFDTTQMLNWMALHKYDNNKCYFKSSLSRIVLISSLNKILCCQYHELTLSNFVTFSPHLGESAKEWAPAESIVAFFELSAAVYWYKKGENVWLSSVFP